MNSQNATHFSLKKHRFKIKIGKLNQTR